MVKENAVSCWTNILEWIVFRQTLSLNLPNLVIEREQKEQQYTGCPKGAYHEVFLGQKWEDAEGIDKVQGWEFLKQ